MEFSTLLIVLAVAAFGFIIWKVFMSSDKEGSTETKALSEEMKYTPKEECGCDECECETSKPIELGVDFHYGIDATAEITRILSEEIEKSGSADLKISILSDEAETCVDLEIPAVELKLETVEVKSEAIEIPATEGKKTPVRKKKPYKKRKKSEFPIKPTEPVEAPKPKSKRGRKPKTKGGDKDQLLLS